jgi:hypothetical protein
MAVKGSKELDAELKRISKGLTAPKLLTKIGLTARADILVRTNKGEDYRGKRFTPYTEYTKSLRRRRGRQVDHVDLQDNRHMLNNMQVKIDARRSITKLVFTRRTEREKAFKHNEVGVGRKQTKREFFSLGKKLENKLFKQYEKEIDRLLK